MGSLLHLVLHDLWYPFYAKGRGYFSSISTFCRKISTIKEIARSLEQMASTQAMNSKHGALRHLLNTKISAAAGNISPLVDAVCSNLTEFARNIVTAQACQLPLYHVRQHHYEATASQGNLNGDNTEYKDLYAIDCCKEFSVTFANATSVQHQSESALSLAGSGVPDAIRNVDYGDSHSSIQSAHRTSLRSCSCQFVSCWGLPCHHMHVLGGSSFMLGGGKLSYCVLCCENNTLTNYCFCWSLLLSSRNIIVVTQRVSPMVLLVISGI